MPARLWLENWPSRSNFYIDPCRLIHRQSCFLFEFIRCMQLLDINRDIWLISSARKHMRCSIGSLSLLHLA